MADEPSREEIRLAAELAIGTFLRELGNDVSTGVFAFVVESIDENGKPGLWMAVGEDQPTWKTLGLCGYMAQVMDWTDDAD